jgi:hypothetical protein
MFGKIWQRLVISTKHNKRTNNQLSILSQASDCMLVPTANKDAILRAFQILPTRQAISNGRLRCISSRSNGRGKSIFKDAKSAEFLASVADKESLPLLGGLPEVSYLYSEHPA